VYVEETSFRSKSIEGVSTTTTGFIGPARYGPFDLEPDVVTSLGEFERTYGNGEPLEFADGSVLDNYLWHAVRAFFTEGGKRLYISRVWRRGDRTEEGIPAALAGYARETVRKSQAPAAVDAIQVWARYPGAAGNLRVRFTLRLGQNVFAVEDPTGTARRRVRGLIDHDVVLIGDAGSPPASDGFYLAESYFSEITKEREWRFHPEGGGAAVELQTFDPDPATTRVRLVTVTVSVMPPGEDVSMGVWDALPLDPRHERAGALDSMFAHFADNPGTVPPGEPVVNLGQARTLPIRLVPGDDLETGLQVLRNAFFAERAELETEIARDDASDLDRSIEITLLGGNDGERPRAGEYEGKEIVLGPGLATVKTGFKTFEDIEDISIVAAPGSTFGYESTAYGNDSRTIINLLIQHAQKMRYRIAVLDSGERQAISQVRALRAQIDSTYAALYYPWVRILDPITGKENYMPPSGFVAGIYCRNDIERAVYKAPANEVVNLSIGFEQLLNKSQQDILNPEGINCFRFFEGRGFRLWGARTVSSDPEWKYVNLRRYFAYLERSIDKGTQWAVFEPNGERLWGNVRRTIEDFLLNEWMMGALLGDKPEKSFFVRCDRSTMTQNDLDNGRLVCLIGVAPLRPAEFVIFRIGQWTADRKV